MTATAAIASAVAAKKMLGGPKPPPPGMQQPGMQQPGQNMQAGPLDEWTIGPSFALASLESKTSIQPVQINRDVWSDFLGSVHKKEENEESNDVVKYCEYSFEQASEVAEPLEEPEPDG